MGSDIGEILVRHGLARPEQVVECRAELESLRARGRTPLPTLTELLVRRGYVEPGALEKTLKIGRSADEPSEVIQARARPGADLGKYVIVSMLGRGGMGEVHRAWDKDLGRYVAIKFIRRADAEDQKRFLREAQLVARLSHPNIAQVFDYGSHEGKPYLVMQLIEGTTIDRAGLTLIPLLRALRDAAVAIDYAHHQGVIHRDLKPSNLMIEGSGPGRPPHAYVMDFGLARETQVESSLSHTGVIVGTPHYMSPEQARGQSKSVEARSDVYSLGATLFALLTRRPPFEGPDQDAVAILQRVVSEEPPAPRSIQSEIPREVETIILKCMEKDPDRRYATAMELAEDVQRYIEGEPIRARRGSVIYGLRKRLSKHRLAAGISFAALAALGALGIVLAVETGRSRDLGAAVEAKEESERRLLEARGEFEEGVTLFRLFEQLLPLEDADSTEVERAARRAESKFRDALALYPNYGEAALQIGRIHFERNDLESALDWCDRALALNPRLAAANLLRALVQLETLETTLHGLRSVPSHQAKLSRAVQDSVDRDLSSLRAKESAPLEMEFAEGLWEFACGRFAEAVRRLENYLELAPGSWAAAHWCGHAAIHEGDTERALRWSNRAVALRPRNCNARIYRAMAYLNGKQIDKALADLDRAVELSPGSAPAYLNRGCARFKKRSFEGAKADFERALEIAPDMIEAKVNLGIALSELGEYRASILAFDRALEQGPGHPGALWQRAEARLELGDLEGSIHDSERALEIDPALASACVARGRASYRARNLVEAARFFSRAVELDPDERAGWFNRGVVRIEQGELQAAIDDLTKALAVDPSYSHAYAHRGIAWFQRNNLEEASRDLDRAVETDPNDAVAYTNRGVIRFATGNRSGAEADWSKAVELAPRALDPRLNRGILRYDCDNLRGAIEDLTRALELDQTCAKAYFYRARCHAEAGDADAASKDCEAVLKLTGAAADLRSRAEQLLQDLRRTDKR